MRRLMMVFLAAVSTFTAACGQGDQSQPPIAINRQAHTKAPAKEATGHNEEKTDSKGDIYVPPTAEEMAPMRPEYLAELAIDSACK